MVVVLPVAVQPVEVDAVCLGDEVVVECVGAGLGLLVRVVVVPAVGAADVVACRAFARRVAAGAGEVAAGEAAAEAGPDSSGVGVSCTSTFDEPLLQPATARSTASAAAIVPVVRMHLLTDAGPPRFTPLCLDA
jgi:hypothetical protein